MATALAPLVLGGHIALGPLLASPCEGLMEGGKAAEFAVVAIKQVRLGQQVVLHSYPKAWSKDEQALSLSIFFFLRTIGWSCLSLVYVSASCHVVVVTRCAGLCVNFGAPEPLRICVSRPCAALECAALLNAYTPSSCVAHLFHLQSMLYCTLSPEFLRFFLLPVSGHLEQRTPTGMIAIIHRP